MCDIIQNTNLRVDLTTYFILNEQKGPRKMYVIIIRILLMMEGTENKLPRLIVGTSFDILLNCYDGNSVISHQSNWFLKKIYFWYIRKWTRIGLIFQRLLNIILLKFIIIIRLIKKKFAFFLKKTLPLDIFVHVEWSTFNISLKIYETWYTFSTDYMF